MSLLFLIGGCLSLIVSVLYALGLLGASAFLSPILCAISAVSACLMFYLFGRYVAEERYARKYQEMCREIDRARKYSEQVVRFSAENYGEGGNYGKTKK